MLLNCIIQSAKYYRPFYSFCSQSLKFDILDIKNSHIVSVKDQSKMLPYMQEVETVQGIKGIVLKLQENSKTVIGFYHPIKQNSSLQLAKITKQVPQKIQTNNAIFDINFNVINACQSKSREQIKDRGIEQPYKPRLTSLSPVLSVCQNLFVGDFINFSGSLGWGRTTAALDLLRNFTQQKDNAFGIYVNTNMMDKRACESAMHLNNCIVFTNDKLSLTSVGVYMIALKAIQTAKLTKKQGNQVLLIMDNFQQIMANQWTVLQNLKLPISPVSIINQLYSNSSRISNQNSLTSITITNSEDEDVIQEYTTLGNNSKHLKTLGKHIQFPLKLKKNHNIIKNDENSQQLRQYVNRYLSQKAQTELQMKLKLNKDAPWQHYFLYDAEWWVTALKKYRPVSLGDRDLFIWFIKQNINADYCAHWKIECIDAYYKYRQFLAQPVDQKLKITIPDFQETQIKENLNKGMQKQQLQSFIEISKHEGYFDIFKKDYLG